MTLTYTNNAQSELAQALTSSQTSITVATGEGARFPDIAAEDNKWFPLTLIRSSGDDYEIVRATARDGDTITIERGEENTPTAIGFDAGDIVSLRMTKAAFDEFLKSGDEDVYFRSLNLATQVNATNDPMLLEIDGVTELYDGLTLTFQPAADNVGLVSIKLNNLDEKELRLPFQAGALLNDGELVTARFYDIRFSEEADRWYLETALDRSEFNATVLNSGIVELSHTSVYDVDNDPTSFSGAAKVPTQRSTAQIIKDFATRIPLGYLPTQWTWKGDGALGSLNGAPFLFGWVPRHYTSATLPQGTTTRVSAGRVPSMRVQTTTTINGLVEFAENATRYPEYCVGPKGSDTFPDGSGGFTDVVGNRPDVTPSQPVDTGGSEQITPSNLAASILAGLELDRFHGAGGAGHVSQGVLDQAVLGRQGLLIVTRDCVIGSTAQIFMPTRPSNEPQQSTVETYHVSPDQQRSNAGRGGGGMFIIASETLSIDDSSQWLLDGPEEAYQTFANLKLAESEQLDNLTFYEAGCGQLFHLNTLTGEIRRWL